MVTVADIETSSTVETPPIVEPVPASAPKMSTRNVDLWYS